ncbi:hypothetical protein [Phyllobacterium sp. P5_D12]
MVDADRGARSVAVRVEDNGYSLDPIATERIFEAFFSTKPRDRYAAGDLPVDNRGA